MQPIQMPERNIARFVHQMNLGDCAWLSKTMIVLDKKRRVWVNPSGYIMSKKDPDFTIKIKKIKEGFIAYIDKSTIEWQYFEDLDEEIDANTLLPVVATNDKQYEKLQRMKILEYKRKIPENSLDSEKTKEREEALQKMIEFSVRFEIFEVTVFCKGLLKKMQTTVDNTSG